jgi:hypothetical protein
MFPTFRANKWLMVACLAVAGLFQAAPVLAQSTRDQIRTIETEYARMHAGRPISDSQLEYYLDRLDSGWSMQRVIDDMDDMPSWRPAPGWTARQVICSSIGSRYAECPVPFRGNAVLLEQISSSACVEGRSWGNKPGAVWVDRGCRARFGNTRDHAARARSVDCASYRGRYRECATGFRGHVYLKFRNRDSSSCIEGRTWGQRPGAVWVRNNCRATFSSVGRPGPRDDMGGGWTRRPNYAVTCVSTGGGRQVCSWDDRYGRPHLIQQIGDTQCIEGRDWGYTVGGGIWVSSGCRATFGYADARYSDYGYRDLGSTTTWVRDPNYGVTCSSVNGQRTVCTWDSRYGTPYLVEQISGSQCIEGRDWGYIGGELWVSSGCRARFGYR